MSASRRGGSARCRRGRAAAIGLGCLALALAWAPPPAAAAEAPPAVSVEDRRSVSEVRGRFEVSVPLPVAWDVLTDYDHIPDFVSSMRMSTVEARVDSGLTVRQEAVAGVFPLRRTAHLLLSVRERPDTSIEFHDVLDRDFRLYRGAWELRAGPTGTRVTYRLDAQPVGATPSFLERAVLSRTVTRLLTQVQAEMVRRAGSGRSAWSGPTARAGAPGAP
jgi:hypothetical protein